MNNFVDVYELGVEDRKFVNTQYPHRLMNRGNDCIENTIYKEMPEYDGLKNAIKGKGSAVACARVRPNFAGNHKYFIILKTKGDKDDDKAEYKNYLYSEANGLYNEMGPYSTIDSALSNADCYGLFEGVDMTNEAKNRIREAIGDYLYDDEDGNPVYDGGEEDWDDLGYDDFEYDGEMEDADYKTTYARSYNHGVKDYSDFDRGFDGEFDDGSLSADQAEDDIERSAYEDLDIADADNENLGNGHLISDSKKGIENANDEMRGLRAMASPFKGEWDYNESNKVEKERFFESLLK